jgi:CBS domain-containing protein
MDDNGGKPEGLVTERDIVTKVCINDAVASSITNKQIMSEPLIVVDSTCTPAAAADMMLQYNVRHLHVVGDINKNKNDTSGWNNLLGIITPLDFARFEELSNDEVGEDKVEMILEYHL